MPAAVEFLNYTCVQSSFVRYCNGAGMPRAARNAVPASLRPACSLARLQPRSRSRYKLACQLQGQFFRVHTLFVRFLGAA